MNFMKFDNCKREFVGPKVYFTQSMTLLTTIISCKTYMLYVVRYSPLPPFMKGGVKTSLRKKSDENDKIMLRMLKKKVQQK